MPKTKAPRLGIALGGGAARGWAHIGILRALEEIDIVPQIVCGASIGALVGAAYASDRLDALQEWVLDLDWWDILRFMEPRSSGLIEGERLMNAFYERVNDVPIESLSKRFGAVATDLLTGQEIWFQKESLGKAVRASIALPGLFSPVRDEAGRWLVDGGLVNPVPVSLCRALGAERIIAVNLNAGILNRQFLRRGLRARTGDFLEQIGNRFQAILGSGASTPIDRDEGEAGAPTLFDVMTGALNIMQDRITRSRMAGDPPDILLAPRLAHLALMDFDRAEDAINEGMACVRRYEPVLKDTLKQAR